MWGTEGGHNLRLVWLASEPFAAWGEAAVFDGGALAVSLLPRNKSLTTSLFLPAAKVPEPPILVVCPS